jgi:Cdc6-like AAA superfamily ATPase
MIRIRHQSRRVKKESGLAHMIESSSSHEIQLQNHALQLRNAKIRRRNLILSNLAVVNYTMKQTAFANLRHPGTCRWLQRTSAYVSWISKQGASCLCCYGIPGSGKSVLAASLRDDLAGTNSGRSDILICYYFCDYSDVPSLEPANILQSFIKQGLEQLSWTTFGDDFECPFMDQSRKHTSLAESSRYLLELVKRYNKTYVLLDGIDELSHDSQSSVLESVDQMMGSGLDMKIFITSRTEEYRVKKALRYSSIIRLSEKHADGDISLLINDKLSRLDPQHPVLLDEALKNEVAMALIDRAKEM